MMRAMDGVRTTRGSAGSSRPAAMSVPGAMPVQASGYVVGMDGIRRPVYRPEPARERVVAATAPKPAAAVLPHAAAPVVRRPVAPIDMRPVEPQARPMMAQPAPAQPEPIKPQPVVEVAQPQTLGVSRFGNFGWRRPAVAFGLVAMAFVASTVAVQALSTPQTSTARAASEQASATPTPAPTSTPAPTPQATGLQQLLDGFVAANPGKFSIVVKNLSTGETAAVDPERQIMSASLYKLFVAQRIYQQIDLGQMTYAQKAGGVTNRTIDGCLTVMINVSDNDCGRALGAKLGWGAQDHALSVEGYKQTSLATPQKTSAADVARLFERLYTGTLVSPASSEKFMGLLKDQRVNNRLPKGLPAGTVFAHKTGDLDGVVHDAGIVYGPKTNYLVVVTSGPWVAPGVAPAQFANLSQQLWNHFEQ